MMNPDVKEKWVAALRSGEFRQGKGLLRDRNDYYCCLGVLCAIAVAENVIPEPDRLPDRFSYDGSDIRLPESVSSWAGDTMYRSGLLPDGPSLMVLNDEIGLTFPEIADIIEQKL